MLCRIRWFELFLMPSPPIHALDNGEVFVQFVILTHAFVASTNGVAIKEAGATSMHAIGQHDNTCKLLGGTVEKVQVQMAPSSTEQKKQRRTTTTNNPTPIIITPDNQANSGRPIKVINPTSSSISVVLKMASAVLAQSSHCCSLGSPCWAPEKYNT